jgi:hypothetical protein
MYSALLPAVAVVVVTTLYLIGDCKAHLEAQEANQYCPNQSHKDSEVILQSTHVVTPAQPPASKVLHEHHEHYAAASNDQVLLKRRWAKADRRPCKDSAVHDDAHQHNRDDVDDAYSAEEVQPACSVGQPLDEQRAAC